MQAPCFGAGLVSFIVYVLGLVKVRVSCYNGNISRDGMEISEHFPAGIR